MIEADQNKEVENMNPVVIIPALNPDEKLINLVEELKKMGLSIVVVNDGSKKACMNVFKILKTKFQCLICHHKKIWGKALPLKQVLIMRPKPTRIAADRPR